MHDFWGAQAASLHVSAACRDSPYRLSFVFPRILFDWGRSGTLGEPTELR